MIFGFVSKKKERNISCIDQKNLQNFKSVKEDYGFKADGKCFL
jgi:hypothetical protein